MATRIVYGSKTLTIKPIEAKLRLFYKKEYKFNPYVSIEINKRTLRSKIHQRGTLNPHWYETFSFDFIKDSMVMIKVMDKRTLVKDHVMAEAYFMASELFASQNEGTKWVKMFYLGGETGHILLRYKLIDRYLEPNAPRELHTVSQSVDRGVPLGTSTESRGRRRSLLDKLRAPFKKSKPAQERSRSVLQSTEWHGRTVDAQGEVGNAASTRNITVGEDSYRPRNYEGHPRSRRLSMADATEGRYHGHIRELGQYTQVLRETLIQESGYRYQSVNLDSEDKHMRSRALENRRPETLVLPNNSITNSVVKTRPPVYTTKVAEDRDTFPARSMKRNDASGFAQDPSDMSFHHSSSRPIGQQYHQEELRNGGATTYSRAEPAQAIHRDSTHYKRPGGTNDGYVSNSRKQSASIDDLEPLPQRINRRAFSFNPNAPQNAYEQPVAVNNIGEASYQPGVTGQYGERRDYHSSAYKNSYNIADKRYEAEQESFGRTGEDRWSSNRQPMASESVSYYYRNEAGPDNVKQQRPTEIIQGSDGRSPFVTEKTFISLMDNVNSGRGHY